MGVRGLMPQSVDWGMPLCAGSAAAMSPPKGQPPSWLGVGLLTQGLDQALIEEGRRDGAGMRQVMYETLKLATDDRVSPP